MLSGFISEHLCFWFVFGVHFLHMCCFSFACWIHFWNVFRFVPSTRPPKRLPRLRFCIKICLPVGIVFAIRFCVCLCNKFLWHFLPVESLWDDLGGLRPKTLQWLGYLIAMLHVWICIANYQAWEIRSSHSGSREALISHFIPYFISDCISHLSVHISHISFVISRFTTSIYHFTFVIPISPFPNTQTIRKFRKSRSSGPDPPHSRHPI